MAVNPSISACYNIEHGSSVTAAIPNKSKDDHEKRTTIFKELIQPIIAELIGTTFFLLLGLLGACSEQNENNSLSAGFAFGLSLSIFIASLGQISGGHFNPAVTLGVLIAGGIQLKKALLYILMQLIGGAMAAGIFRLLSHASTYHYCHGGATMLVTMQVKTTSGGSTIDRIDWWEGIAIELLLTFVFVTIILMVTMEKKLRSDFAPIYIGLTLCVCVLASNMLTGGSLNPARSLGPAIFANIWSHHYIYWIGPLTGAAIAGGLHRFLWAINNQEK